MSSANGHADLDPLSTEHVSALLKEASIGKRLRLVREAMGMTQKAFSKKARIAASTYNQWEQGKARPSFPLPSGFVLRIGLPLIGYTATNPLPLTREYTRRSRQCGNSAHRLPV